MDWKTVAKKAEAFVTAVEEGTSMDEVRSAYGSLLNTLMAVPSGSDVNDLIALLGGIQFLMREHERLGEQAHAHTLRLAKHIRDVANDRGDLRKI